MPTSKVTYDAPTARRLRQPPPGGDSGGSFDTMAGTALTGGSIFNGLDGSNLDAVENEGADLDGCLSHSSPFGELHYHSLSPCVNDASSVRSTTAKPGQCDEDDDCLVTTTWMMDGWTNDSSYGGAYGVARDGHVIYGPYNSDGELWGCDDHDVCNGFWLEDGAYGYASTTTFPYVVGCWGPGPMQHYEATCSSLGCTTFSSDNYLDGTVETAEDIANDAVADGALMGYSSIVAGITIMISLLI